MAEPLRFGDIEVGHVDESPEIEVSHEEMVAYARANDPFPIHVDEQFAASTPYGGLIASFGYVVGLFFRGLHAMPSNQQGTEGFIGAVGWKVDFRAAVRGGDRLRVRTTVADKRLSSKPGRGVVTTSNEILDAEGETKVVIEITSLYVA